MFDYNYKQNEKLKNFTSKDLEDHHHLGKRAVKAEIPPYCARRPRIVTGPKAGEIIDGNSYS